MRYFNLLTVILFLLKALGIINIGWGLVFLPTIISVVSVLVLIIVAFILGWWLE